MTKGAPIVRALGVGAGYGLFAFLSLSVTRFGADVESIWLSNALLSWALVTAPRGQWLWYVAAAALGHVGAHMLARDSLEFTLAFLLGDIAECLLVAVLLQLRSRTLAFESRAATFYFLLVCGIVAPAVSATIALGASAIVGDAMSVQDFMVWYAADALGLIVFLPIFYAVGEGRWRRLSERPLRTLIGMSAVASLSVLSGLWTEVPTLRLLLLPVFVIIAFELGVAGVQAALGILMVSWVGLTVSGRPVTPWTELSSRDYLIVLQIFMAIFAATILPLAATLEEKQRLNETLANVLKETQEAWGAIIGAEARYRLVVDNVSETVMRISPDGVIQFASPACVALLHGDHDITGRNLFDLLHPEDRDIERERMNQCIAQGLLNLVHRGKWRIKGDDNTWTLIDARVTLVSPVGRGHEEFLAVLRPENA